MLGTIIKALEVDCRNANNEKYLRSDVNIRQTLSRILSARKHYPEFNAKQTLMFPKLAELGKLTRKEGLCLSYWHDCSEISEFRNALSTKIELVEKSILASRPSRFKTASLSRFMQRGEDVVLMNYLGDIARGKRTNLNERQLNTQAHRQQVTGLLYNLHVLDEQLRALMLRRTPKLNFAPHNNRTADHSMLNDLLAPNSVAPNLATHNFDPQNHDDSSMRNGAHIAANQASPPDTANKHAEFDMTGPVDIWYSLAEDPRTPYRFLVWLSENHNPYISQRARATLDRHQEQRNIAQRNAQRAAQRAVPTNQKHLDKSHSHVNTAHPHTNTIHPHVNGSHPHVNTAHPHVNGSHPPYNPIQPVQQTFAS